MAAPRRAVVREALALAFGGHASQVTAFASLEDALAASSGETQWVVLGSAAETELDRALAAVDPSGLPRWAIVACGPESVRPGVEVVAEADFEPRLVARALRSSWSALELRRQVARERGDVWTLGRRVTHDLRNPLGCIVTTAEMLKEVLAEEAPQHLPLTEAILESTGEMLDLINRVHQVAKASAQPKAAEVFDMGAAHQAAIDRLQREITRRGASVAAPEEWPEVRAVRPWVEMIWGDLLSNALRHAGEPLRIQTGWQREEDCWTFWVADNGPGVPRERQPALFTPFHRLHTRHGGGLGLSVVHRLAELLQGRCSYQGRPEGGSVFLFSLPAEGAATPSAPAAAASAGGWTAHLRLSPDGLTASPTPAG